MEDRQILNGVLVVNEMLHMRLKDKKPGLVFKVDMEKGYDLVDQNFMGYLFDRMDFDHRWKKWMRACVEDATYSVQVNGSPIEPIAANKGFKQDDPLSPYIFTLVREGLNKLVEKARNLGIVRGFSVIESNPW